MQKLSWYPSDEATATSTLAAFIEWRRADGGRELAGAAALWAWAAAEPAEFAAAIGRFAGLRPGLGYAGNLARAMGRRGEIVLIETGGARRIGASALLAGDVPQCIAAMLAAGSWAALCAHAADHLLRLEIRPDQRVAWRGPLDDPWPLGALLAGATLILGRAPPADAISLRRPD